LLMNYQASEGKLNNSLLYNRGPLVYNQNPSLNKLCYFSAANLRQLLGAQLGRLGFVMP
jgi:hypothetical protein